MDLKPQFKNLVPLSRVVRSAIVDSYGDISATEELYSHWAARGFRKLLRQALRVNPRKVLLNVNKNTHTATLPPDFKSEVFVGIINDYGRKEPLLQSEELVDTLNIDDEVCVDKCIKCMQEKTICDELTITTETNPIVINSISYNQTIVKTLQENGNYELVTTTPVLDTQTNLVSYITDRKFITHFDRKVCGCLEDTAENIEKIKCYCEDVYCSHYAPCSPCSKQYGSYRIFEDSGLIQFNPAFPFKKVYLEYMGFMPKIRGDYYVPEVAFETLVEWTKWRSIANKKGVPRWERKDAEDSYKRELANLKKELGKINLSIVIAAIGLNPKFDY